jgi:uncharacterized membrane protein YdbT with pleckstrin-like domain
VVVVVAAAAVMVVVVVAAAAGTVTVMMYARTQTCKGYEFLKICKGNYEEREDVGDHSRIVRVSMTR